MRALEEKDETLNILGATSGDTGSAAEYAMRGKRGIRVFMLSPHKRMTAFQSAQMYALQDANIHNLAVKGVFDDCQDVVKKVNADAAFKAQHRIGAVNSINWARVAAQVVYYFKGYFAATRDDREPVAFAVPSGNFGNIYAGYVARSMGLPIKHLILASNENDVLDEFFRTGKYRVKRKVKHTTSPSMDISKASNFERYVFDLVERDPARVKDLWRRLEAEGEFDLSHSPFWPRVAQTGFVSGKSTHSDRISTIRAVFEKYRRDDRSAHRRRREGGPGVSRARGAAHLPGDRAAGEVRRHPARSARPRAAAAGGVPRPRAPAAALHPDRAGCRRRQALYCLALMNEKNVLGGELRACSYDPLTGYFRDGCCATHDQDGVAHLVCVQVTQEFLDFSVARGNDLVTPRPDLRFRGLAAGNRWCLHVLRWIEAWEAGRAPRVILEATHENVLNYVPLSALKRYALDLN